MKKLRITSIAFIMMIFAAMGLQAQTSSVSDFQGTYQLQDNPYVKSIKLTANAGKLVMSAEGFPDAELAVGKQADEFILESMNAVISFTREAGKVKSIKIDAQGQELKGELVASKAGLDRPLNVHRKNQYTAFSILNLLKNNKTFLCINKRLQNLLYLHHSNFRPLSQNF